MPKIAIIDDYVGNVLSYADWSQLPADCSLQVYQAHADGPDALVTRLAPYDIVCCMRERTVFDRAVLARLPNLKLLCSTAAYNAAIDVQAAADLGIKVCGTGAPDPGFATAELTWALILGLTRQVHVEDANMRAARWQTTMGRDLKYLTLGVIGLGRLGTPVARVGAAFGMNVIAWSPNMTEARAREAGASLVTKDILLAQSDVVTVHMALSERTRDLLGADDLRKMKKDAILVNTSRGPLINEAALVQALKENWIAGAALDVFDQEPLPGAHPLRRLPNTLLTPHIGYSTEATYKVFIPETVENIVAFLAGKPIRVMNPKAQADRSQPKYLD
ncbi:MAG: D-2-hydroxyacid dehydrogenase family protein [Proteobacteria bacterium]|nr:D-2-hydroxyacid dehydrogenase family protein [Pseudomonadota bacterium]MDA1059923.1 D-2-hydroxyacid dehydrogenase family protein [Pseudomonadota bacterium]